MKHQSGFVNIIGRPNVGKSTLLNALIGERLSIVSSKAQTTRHRLLAFLNDDNYQIIFSDTPGILKPSYQLHEKMMSYVNEAIDDADVLICMTDIFENIDEIEDFTEWQRAFKIMKHAHLPVMLIINKIDLIGEDGQLEALINKWKNKLEEQTSKKDINIVTTSALHKQNTDQLVNVLLKDLPEGPEYYPKDQITDKPERFFVSEKVREKIFLNYKKEVPYSTECTVLSFKEEDDIIRIEGEIIVERKTQKAIIIGKAGAGIKKIGSEARVDLEDFFQKKVFLSLYVKVREDWRNKGTQLRNFGY